MTKIIMNGCNGKMGQVITRLVSEDNECEIRIMYGSRTWK